MDKEDGIAKQESVQSAGWWFAGRKIPKNEIIYFTQISIIAIVIAACIVNLSITSNCDQTLWASLLGACIGYVIPAPVLERKDRKRGLDYRDGAFLSNTA